MSGENIVKGRVLRRVLNRIVDLISGALTLDNYTIGLARDDDTLVARDDVGGFHYFPGLTALNAIVVNLTYARAPVNTQAQLPSTDPDGAIRLVISEGLFYSKASGVWSILTSTLTLGETQATAYRGDRGKTAYDHSQITGNPHGTTIENISGLSTALAAKFYGNVSNNRIPQGDSTGTNKLKDSSWETYFDGLQPIENNKSDLGALPKRIKSFFAYVINIVQAVQFFTTAGVMRSVVGYGGTIDVLKVIAIGSLSPTTPKVLIGNQNSDTSDVMEGSMLVGSWGSSYSAMWAGALTPSATNEGIRLGVNATLINAPTSVDNVHIRHGETEKNVVFNADPITNAIKQNDVTSVVMGGYSTSGWAIWGGNVTPTTTNYGVRVSPDASSAEINGGTESSLRVVGVSKVKATSSGAEINGTLIVDQDLSVSGVLQAASIFSNGLATLGSTAIQGKCDMRADVSMGVQVSTSDSGGTIPSNVTGFINRATFTADKTRVLPYPAQGKILFVSNAGSSTVYDLILTPPSGVTIQYGISQLALKGGNVAGLKSILLCGATDTLWAVLSTYNL